MVLIDNTTSLREKIIVGSKDIMYAAIIVFFYANLIRDYVKFGEITISFIPFAILLVAACIDTFIKNYYIFKKGKGNKNRIIAIGIFLLSILVLIYTYSKVDQSILFWGAAVVYQTIEGIYDKYFDKK